MKRNRKLTQDPTHAQILLAADDNNSSEIYFEGDEI